MVIEVFVSLFAGRFVELWVGLSVELFVVRQFAVEPVPAGFRGSIEDRGVAPGVRQPGDGTNDMLYHNIHAMLN
jgi:hypothetical protein